MNPDAAMRKGTGLVFKKVAVGRVVQIDIEAVGEEEFHLSERIFRSRWLDNAEGEFLGAYRLPVNRMGTHYRRIRLPACVQQVAAFFKIGGVLAQFRQYLIAGNAARHCPCRVEIGIFDLVRKHRCLVIGLADNHPAAVNGFALAANFQQKSRLIDQHMVLAKIGRKPAPAFHIDDDLTAFGPGIGFRKQFAQTQILCVFGTKLFGYRSRSLFGCRIQQPFARNLFARDDNIRLADCRRSAPGE